MDLGKSLLGKPQWESPPRQVSESLSPDRRHVQCWRWDGGASKWPKSTKRRTGDAQVAQLVIRHKPRIRRGVLRDGSALSILAVIDTQTQQVSFLLPVLVWLQGLKDSIYSTYSSRLWSQALLVWRLKFDHLRVPPFY